MSSKRTRNRLYWALVNARAFGHSADARVLELYYVASLTGDTDTSILTPRSLQDSLGRMEELYGPAGHMQVHKDRPYNARTYVDQLREETLQTG